MTDLKRLVIFDVDGTLFRTDCVTVPAVQRTFVKFGLASPDRKTILGFFGKSVASYENWMAEQCPPGQAPKIVAAANALELQLVGEEGLLYSGVQETLETLQTQKYLMAICSNGPQAYVDEVLDQHRLRKFFPVVYARDMQYSGKKEMVRLILDTMAPDDFAVIGDRHDDIEAAHTWNGHGIAAAYGFGDPEEWRNADMKIKDITQAPDSLTRVFNIE
ncbi:MAG: HAD family hydrolase [Candidatus Hydrogenedentes bacterium]|nr:HAD family hydrolase [Candidatus Hydrogenedentota bacterium]